MGSLLRRDRERKIRSYKGAVFNSREVTAHDAHDCAQCNADRGVAAKYVGAGDYLSGARPMTGVSRSRTILRRMAGRDQSGGGRICLPRSPICMNRRSGLGRSGIRWSWMANQTSRGSACAAGSSFPGSGNAGGRMYFRTSPPDQSDFAPTYLNKTYANHGLLPLCRLFCAVRGAK